MGHITTFRNNSGFTIRAYVLPILLLTAMFASTQGAFAGITNSTSTNYIDTFETYTNNTPLIAGTNGWYGSSADIIAQGTTFFSGAKAAKIPVDCTLSNRFETNVPSTNVWLQMDARVTFYDSTNQPAVDTNAAGMFYINTNGFFVVHVGPTTNPAASTNWAILTTDTAGGPITPVVSNTWARVLMYQNYANTNWSLYLNHALLTNNIGFINTNITNFAGFDLYNGSSTTYLDNVTVMATASTNNLPPDVDATPKQLTNSVMLGLTPPTVIQTFTVTNSGPAISYGVAIDNTSWLQSLHSSGTLPANSSNEFILIYSNIPSSWAAGVSNQIVWITTTNWGGTQSVAAVNVTLNIMDLQVTPLNLTNAAWVGETPTSQTFNVRNAGGGSFTYTAATGASWLACSSNGGTLGANSTNTLTLNYANTAGWPQGTSNTTVTIASSDGGGASRTVNVTLSVSNVQASMSVSPTLLSNVVWVGGTPTNNRTFEVRNAGGCPLDFTAVDTNSCSWITGVVLTPGTVPAYGTNVMTLSYGSTAGWTPGASSNTAIKVVSTNGSGATQFVNVVLSVLGVSNVMDVAPLNLTNGAAVGATPVSQGFAVINSGDADFTYGVATNVAWLTSSTTGGLLTARGTSTVTLTYANTTGWPPGTSNGTVTVTATSGGGATKNVGVTLYIYSSGISNTIPFYDDFEQYTNLTPLVGGIKGWYGSSAGIIVQQNVKWAGLQAAKIPADCTLSNLFVPASTTNVWIQMDLRPSLYNGVTNPMVDTNQAAMLYINSNGNFVVHNGPTTNASASTNWVELTNGGIATNGTNWVKIGIYEDFTRKTWDLYTNGGLKTNGIGFINTALTNFAGFDVCNGSQTSYVDNVVVEAPGTVLVNPTNRAFQVMKGLTASNQFTLTAQTGIWTFANTTSATWLAVNPVAGVLDAIAAPTNTDVWISCVNQVVGSYTGAVNVSATNGYGLIQTQTVAVTMDVMDLQVSPTNLTNQVWIGATPASQTFEVLNAGAGSFRYETQTGAFWIACTSNEGTLGAYRTNTLTLNYVNTAGWAAGTSSSWVKVWSTNGGGATQTVNVTLYVNDLVAGLQVTPTNFTNSTMAGFTPTNLQSFTVTNTGDGSFNYTATNADWLSNTATNGTLASHGNVVIPIMYTTNTTIALAPGRYTNTIAVASVNGSGATTDVTVILNVMGMNVTPSALSNTVMVGWAPGPQTGQVINLGPAAFGYTVTVTNNWLSCAPTTDTVAAYSSNAFVVTYSNTVNWTPGTTSNTAILIASPDGSGTNRTVNISLTVVGRGTNFYVSTNGLGIAPYTNWVMAATNIQDAVNAAIISGDRVWVSNGVFTLTNQVSVTNNIIIEGAYGRTITFINGNYPATTNRCFNVANTNAVVQGFTITNGCAEFGGGVYLTAGATLNDCVVSGNRAAATVLEGGGGICADSSNTVTNCVIVGNTSAGLAGGLLLEGGATAYNCQISNNAAAYEGGGVVVRSDSAIWNSTIASNRTTAVGAHGGGVTLGENTNDLSTLWNCTLANNSADVGGGLAAFSGFARNCLIHLNSAGIAGAGVYVAENSDVAIENCTISSNGPSYGVYCHASAGGYFGNSVVVSNAIMLNGANVAFTNNCVESTNGLPGSGNITNDPAFLNFAAGNYRLSAGSPCLNTGTNQAWMVGATDLDGSPRINGPSVDMGAYEKSMSWTVTPGTLANQIMVGLIPTNQGFAIINQGSNTLYYRVTTNASWVTASTNSGTLGTYETNTLVVSYGVTTGWTPGRSNAAVNVVVTNDSALYPPQTQTVSVIMDVMQMQLIPASLTNTVIQGLPSSNTFDVMDLGKGLLAYTVSSNGYAWVSVNPTGGVLTNEFTNTITVTYAATLPIGLTTGLLTVASSSGGGVTQYVALSVNVLDMGMQAVPSSLTNDVLIGYTPTNQNFKLINTGAASLTYTLAINAPWISLTDPASGALNAPGTNTITVSYAATTGWTPGTSNALVTIASTNGLGSTQTVAIVLHVTPLLPPSGVTASKGTFTDKVVLSWAAASDAVGYEIWRNTSSDQSTAQKISSTDVIGTSYADTGATNGVLYTYWVKTKGSSGTTSAFSTSDTGWRGLPAPSVNASKGLRREVRVTWNASAGATSYELWKNTVNESSSATLLPFGAATSYRDIAVTPGSRYYYWVKAVCAQGNSGFGTSSEGWCGAAKWDFNGDGRAESWYYHEASGRWYVMMTTNMLSTVEFGGAGWQAVPADYDWDGVTDLAVYNASSGAWHIKLSAYGYETIILTGFGSPGFTGVVEDYDGDGMADPAIFAETSGTWQIAMSAYDYQLVIAIGFGSANYSAVPADYDGDGKVDPAIYKDTSGNWYMALSGLDYQVNSVTEFGQSGYVPVPGSYDGLGYAQLAVYDNASGDWYIRTGPGPDDYYSGNFGFPGCVPMQADYDGDQREDECVFYRDRYDATWYLLMSTEGFRIVSGRMSRP